ncbi:MAG: hypothetical protein Roseis2KO_12650 [Roseivirga sp.]
MTAYGQETSSDPVNPRKFEGLYIGVNTGVQSIFSEAIINESSIPQQASRWTADFLIAHRWQFLNDRIVFGLEVQVGMADGDLDRTFGTNPGLAISFANSTQVGVGYTFGYVIGKQKKLLLYSYLYQVRRSFNITLRDDTRILLWQQDSQTVLRYGLGLEYNLSKHFSTRLGLGSQRGKSNFNETAEVTIGLNYQF